MTEEEIQDTNISMLERRGMMVILSAPPGGGKTSISQALVKTDPYMTFSVSTTTRDQRSGEVEGIDYNFVDDATFKEKINNGDMLEYALVYNKSLYGTEKEEVERTLRKGRDVIFDIDWQGHLTLKAKAPKDIVSIFILPPNYAELEKRLHDRERDTEDDIKMRMTKAKDETSHYKEFQYILINNNLEESIDKVKSIIYAERLKRRRLTNLDRFVNVLDKEVI